MNHHSRYDVSQRKRCDVPQEVPHGDNLLYREAYPTPHTLHSPPPHDKAYLFTVSPATIRHATVAAITPTRATAAVPHSR